MFRAESEPKRTYIEPMMGMWGIWLLTGLTWFSMFVQAPGPSMAGLALYGLQRVLVRDWLSILPRCRCGA